MEIQKQEKLHKAIQEYKESRECGAVLTAFMEFIKDEEFNSELKILQRDFVGRPTPLYFAENLTNNHQVT